MYFIHKFSKGTSFRRENRIAIETLSNVHCKRLHQMNSIEKISIYIQVCVFTQCESHLHDENSFDISKGQITSSYTALASQIVANY